VETESENTSDGPSGALSKCDRNGIVTDSVVGWRKVDSWVPAVWFSGALPPLDWHSGAVSLTCITVFCNGISATDQGKRWLAVQGSVFDIGYSVFSFNWGHHSADYCLLIDSETDSPSMRQKQR